MLRVQHQGGSTSLLQRQDLARRFPEGWDDRGG
jgi:hypothetical protein